MTSRCDCLDKIGTERGACFSDDHVYRYALWRTWDRDLPPLFFLMLNPSSADADFNDRTINRIGGFARTLGHGGIIVGNAFALVSTDPELLKKRTFAAIGPRNDEHLAAFAENATRIIVGWGTHLSHRTLSFRLPGLQKLLGDRCEALQINADGSPAHPLYLRADAAPQRFDWRMPA